MILDKNNNINTNTIVIIVFTVIIFLIVLFTIIYITVFGGKIIKFVNNTNDKLKELKEKLNTMFKKKEKYIMYPESTEPTVPPDFYRYRHEPVELTLNEKSDGYYITKNNDLFKNDNMLKNNPLIKNPKSISYDKEFDKSYFTARPFYYTQQNYNGEKCYPKYDNVNIATNNMPYLDVNKKTGQLNDYPFQLNETSNGIIAPSQPVDKLLNSDLFNPNTPSINKLQNTPSLEYLKNNSINFGIPDIYKNSIGYAY